MRSISISHPFPHWLNRSITLAYVEFMSSGSLGPLDLGTPCLIFHFLSFPKSKYVFLILLTYFLFSPCAVWIIIVLSSSSIYFLFNHFHSVLPSFSLSYLLSSPSWLYSTSIMTNLIGSHGFDGWLVSLSRLVPSRPRGSGPGPISPFTLFIAMTIMIQNGSKQVWRLQHKVIISNNVI